MPIHSYECESGCKFERLFLTFKAADKEPKTTLCDVCKDDIAERQISMPGIPILYGEGFYKPAASGKLQTVCRDTDKFIKEENISVMASDGSKFGRNHLEKAKAISKQIRRSRRSK